ncbi:MAG: alanyl-tRNA editing protein [Microthrixaceae bacterium]
MIDDNTALSTDQLYLQDAYERSMQATVVAVDGDRAALDRTVFYATGGGQPHDTGTLSCGDRSWPVVDVRKEGRRVWHRLAPAGVDGAPAGPASEVTMPEVGTAVVGTLDWERRHALMRTHTALHVLGGVIWNRWRVPATGGNMEPLSARMDFEFGPLPEGFRDDITGAVTAELAADRPVEVNFLDRGAADVDPALIRTKVNLIPASVTRIRVVDIVGLDRQADGGTHVASTAEVGTFAIVKTESKGKGNKRLRIAIGD